MWEPATCDIAHPSCCGQLTAVKTGYYMAVMEAQVSTHRGYVILKFSADKLLVFHWLQAYSGSTPSKFLCNGYKFNVWSKLWTSPIALAKFVYYRYLLGYQIPYQVWSAALVNDSEILVRN